MKLEDLTTDIVDQIARRIRTATKSDAEAFELALALLGSAAQKERTAALVLSSPEQTPASTRLTDSTADPIVKAATSSIRDLFNQEPKLVEELEWRSLQAINSKNPSQLLESYLPSFGSDLAVLPQEVAKLLCLLAEVKCDETTYVPWDLIGQLGTRFAAEGARVFIETPVRSAIPHYVQLITGLSISAVEHSDPIEAPSFATDKALTKFDVAVAFPPVGARYPSISVTDKFNRFPENTASSSVLAIRHLLAQASRRVVALVPCSLLSNTGVEEALRKSLLENGQVEAVIGMPLGLIKGFTPPLSILVLNPKGGQSKVRFIDASTGSFHTSLSRARTKLTNEELLASSVLNREATQTSNTLINDVDVQALLESNANLLVQRYVSPPSAQHLLQLVPAVSKVRLGDIVKTVRPLPLAIAKSQASDPSLAIHVAEIGALDLPEFGSISSPGRVLHLSETEESKCAMHYLRPLDIVLIIKGSVGKIGIVPEDLARFNSIPLVTGQSGITLRVTDNRIDPRTLYLQLRSTFGRELLSRLVTGTTTPLIQLRELNELFVVLPSQEEQRRCIQALRDEDSIQEEIDQLRKKQKLAAEGLWKIGKESIDEATA